MGKQVIPKIIHYCWFGGKEKPPLVKECIQSWHQFCPDYEIIEWNETNFDLQSNTFVSEAYASKKWAFVSDYVRLYALCNYGGIYLDSDVELLKPIDVFLTDEGFTGFESNDTPVTAIMGCRKDFPLFKQLLDYYHNRHFIVNGKMDTLPNTFIITETMKSHGLIPNGKQQTICGCTIYPEAFFCPNYLLKVFNRYSAKTYCVHHFMGSWGSNPVTGKRSFMARMKMYITHEARNLLGTHRTFVLGQMIRNVLR